MSTDPQVTLTRLGLSDAEASLYLTLLACGAQPVQVIARETKVSRTAAYEILDSLERRGLVVKKTDGTKWKFIAEDPEKLEAYFSQRLRSFEVELETLKRMAPELRVKQGAQDTRPRVRFLSGYEGLAAIFEDVERVSPDEICEFVDGDHLSKFVDLSRVRKIRQNISLPHAHIRFLYHGKDFVPISRHAEYRRVHDGEAFRGSFWIYANRVVFVNYQGSMETLAIDHHIFAETARALFERAWECATPVEVVPS